VYGFRSTDPRALRVEPDPVGVDNDLALLAMASLARIIVCAWGTHVSPERAAHVRKMLAPIAPLHYLKLNKGGTPCHPLYQRADLPPRPWT
jgi:hypothetical protein